MDKVRFMASTITVTTTTSTGNNEQQSFRMTMKTTWYMLNFVLKEKKPDICTISNTLFFIKHCSNYSLHNISGHDNQRVDG